MKFIHYKKRNISKNSNIKKSLLYSPILLVGCFSLPVWADITHPDGATLATYGTGVTTFCFSTVSDPTCVNQPDLGALTPNGSTCQGVVGGQTALGTTTQTTISSLTYDTNNNAPTGGTFCPFRDSAGLLWAIDLATLSEAGITACRSTDLFSSNLGCRPPAPIPVQVSNPQNVPVFGPIALLASILSLFGFGYFKRKK